jgi:Fe-S-cluster containining protein
MNRREREQDVKLPWYAGGLRFTCTQCGNCCGGAPGFVWISDDEIAAIARRLGMEVAAFERRHVRKFAGRKSLKELKNGDCEFLTRGKDGKTGCSIYEDRPVQCRTWPFWRENLETPEAWAMTAVDCPGMNNGRHHALPVIQEALRRF